MRPSTAISKALCYLRPQILSSPSLHNLQVGSLSSLLSLFLTKFRFSTVTSLSESSSPSSLGTQSKATHLDLSSVCFSGIAQSVISKCSHLLEKNEKCKIFAYASPKDLLLRDISDIVPEYTRRFRRVSELKPEDVLEILLGFQFECEKVGFGARKVESLWGLFRWASEQSKDFEHLPQSYEVMARMLVQAGLLREVEFLLSSMESQGVSLDSHQIFSNMIEGYAGNGELESAISIYDRMKRHGFAPSLSCYCILLDHLVRMKRTQMAFQVCMDMVDMGIIDLSDRVKAILDSVTRLLCADGKIQEARNLVKKVMSFGFKLSNSAINGIVYGYCEKRDFDDLLRFFLEIKCAPDVLAGNRIIHSLCSYFSTEMAESFMLELENLGFVPDEITFGILIGWSCHEGKLRNSLVYLAEIFSRRLEPHICSYNALISGLFLKGMCKHAQDVFDEMMERGTTPDLSTFRILLAGYCKSRQFDDVKRTVCEMENRGIVQNLSLDGQLSRAFLVLGFNPLTVRLKRDNDAEFSKAEFFDNLGNGLYLDTDLDEYEKRVKGIPEHSLVLDYNSLVLEDCNHGNMKGALALADEMVQWGQEFSLSVFSALLRGLCASRYPIKVISNIFEKNPKLINLLDQETLNLLVQVYCKRGWTYNGKIVLDSMLHRHLKFSNETYTAILTGFCKRENFRDFHGWWDIAREEKWVPGLRECKVLLECLCKKEMLKEALELLENMLVSFPHLRLDISNLFLEKLSLTSFRRVAHIVLEELNERGCVMDHVAYSHIIRGMCKEKNFSGALKLLDNLLAKNLAPCLDASVLLLPQLCRANRHDKAIVLKEICLRQHSFSSLSVNNAVIKGFCMTRKVGEASTLFQEMLLKGIIPDAETYNILVQGLCKVENLRKVGELVGVILRRNFELSISTYRSLVHLLCMEGKVLQALKLKELMIGQSKSHDLIIYNILIFSLFSTGNSLFVNEVLDDLQKKKLELDEVSYNFLLYGFSLCKDVPSTLHYLSTTVSMELRPSNRSLRAAIMTLCNSSELEKALELSQKIELRGWVHDSIVQNAIVGSLLSCGKLREAENYLDRIVEKCLLPDNINYDNLIKCFCSHGRLSKAVNLLNIMLKKGVLPSSNSYDSIVSSCCSSNRPNEAMDFHNEMLEKGLKPSISTWNLIVHHLCQDGRTSEAERILISMAHAGETPTREMFTSVINRYHFENNPRKATDIVQAMQRSGYEPDFETHWSLIGNLRNSYDKAKNSSSQGFLSRLLSESGFIRKK